MHRIGTARCLVIPFRYEATRLAIRSYVRSILSSLTDVELKLGTFSLAVGIAVPLLVTVLALAYATRRLARTDVA